MKELTHFNIKGRARMVDVSGKIPTERTAIARGSITMKKETLKRIKEGGIKKGDVLTVADVSAVMAAKKTSDFIPMCHPIPLTGVNVDFKEKKNSLEVKVTVRCVGNTGVEMEALTAVAAALLTIYDMCKSIDRGMRVEKIELLEKKGGRSGHWKKGIRQ